jgi:hypothetical protein
MDGGGQSIFSPREKAGSAVGEVLGVIKYHYEAKL